MSKILYIIEDDDTKTAYVDSDKGENLGSELTQSMQQNTATDSFKVSNDSITGKDNTSKPEITIKAKDGTDAMNKINDLKNKNTNFRNMLNDKNNQPDIIVQREGYTRSGIKIEEDKCMTMTKDLFNRYLLWKN